MDADQVPKYLNSPETPIYSKGRTLYGLNLTKAGIRKLGFVVLVEGYFDFAQVFQSQAAPVGRVVRHGADAAAGAAAPAVHVEGRPQLRPGRGRAGGGRAIVRAARRRGLRRQRRGAGQRRRSRYIHPTEGRRRSIGPGCAVAARTSSICSIRRPPAWISATPRRQRAFLAQDAGGGRWLPEPAMRDQFADRVAHTARITAEVVRAEIRKVAARRQTTLAPAELPSLGEVKKAEKALIWWLIQRPAEARDVLGHARRGGSGRVGGAATSSKWPGACTMRPPSVYHRR